MGTDNRTTLMAAWYSIRSDRSQRYMLKGLAKEQHATGEMSDKIYDHVMWLLGECDTLAEARDDTIHAPLVSSRGRVEPQSSGNPRAKNLVNKDLLIEYRWCRDFARSLTDFCLFLDSAVHYGWSLPDKPARPARGRTRSRSTPPRQPRKR